MKHLLIILSFITSVAVQAQQKEILIIGTMHTVPSIVKHNYAPLLKRALAYKPDAILTEDIMPEDSLSLKNFTPGFLKKAEASRQTIDEQKVQQLLKKPLTDMSHENFEYLATAFLQNKDRANYDYYTYLAQYGLQGCKKPLRNESGDITHKLAIAMGIRKLLPIDNHHNDKAYNSTWAKAVNSGAENGDLKKYAKLSKKNTRKQNISGLLGRLGRFTNKRKTLQHYYSMNSVRYVDHPNELTTQAMQLWDERNQKMAQNIIRQMSQTTGTRYVLIVGAGHVISLEKALKNLQNDIIIKTL